MGKDVKSMKKGSDDDVSESVWRDARSCPESNC